MSFGLDHWGIGATDSGPIAVDYARPHELVLLAGFLLPPGEGAAGGRDHELFLQRERLIVWLDGHPVFSMAGQFFPVPRESLSFGLSFIGGSTAAPEFTGEILDFGPAPDSAWASIPPVGSSPGPF